MSLHHLGISHLSVLHRQYSTPPATGSLESSPGQDLMQDNKDVLIERLSDLLARVARDDSLEDSIVTSIHSQVDRIEQLMHQTSEKVGKENADQGLSLNDEDVFWGQLTPTKNVRMRLPDRPSTSSRCSIPQTLKIAPPRGAELAIAAEELSSQLAATVADLRTRKEESDVSQDHGHS
jgi:hypothetical protein